MRDPLTPSRCASPRVTSRSIDKSLVQSRRLPIAPGYQPYWAPSVRHGLVQNGEAMQQVFVVEIAAHHKCQELAAQHHQRVAAALKVDLLCRSLMLFVTLSLAQVNVASPHECC
jgi:hypothetical protein